MNSIDFKTGSWCGDKTIKLDFPSHWVIRTHEIAMLPELNERKIETSFGNPVAGFKIESLLKPGKKVAVVIDDHTRPTPVADILRPLLKIFSTCGILKKNIKIIAALGTHILRDKTFMKNKLDGLMGGDIEFVFPDCRDNRELVHMGISESGIPLLVNRHFAEADVKIAVSGIYPHDEAGFSGGAKILIGILGLETLSRFHRKYGLLERGRHINTEFRDELEHFADLLELDYSVNCIININKKIAALYCGDFRKAFRAAAKKAQNCLGTDIDPNADLVICNAYPMDTSLCVLGKSRWPFNYCKKSAYKIILTSLSDPIDNRVPLAINKKEFYFQKFKKKSGISFSKRMFIDMSKYLKNLCHRSYKWKQPYVVFVPYMNTVQFYRPRFINGNFVEYGWKKIVDEISQKVGYSYPLKTSIYSHAPLFFPRIHC